MSFDEIIEEIPKLSLAQRRVLVAKIVELEPLDDGPVTWDVMDKEAGQMCDQEEKSR
jgi:hypothetical protein